MSEPRHVSKCIDEWLDEYQERCPFNLADALAAIRDEMKPPTKGPTHDDQ